MTEAKRKGCVMARVPPREATRKVGKNLRHIREAVGMTMEEVTTALAESGYETSISCLSYTERGERKIHVEMLYALSVVYGAPIGVLVDQHLTIEMADGEVFFTSRELVSA